MSVFVRFGKPERHLLDDAHRIRHREPARAPEPFSQSLAFQILHHQEEKLLSDRSELVEHDQVLVPELHHDLRLAVKPCDAFLSFAQLRAKKLDGPDLVQEGRGGLCRPSPCRLFQEARESSTREGCFPRSGSASCAVLVHWGPTLTKASSVPDGGNRAPLIPLPRSVYALVRRGPPSHPATPGRKTHEDGAFPTNASAWYAVPPKQRGLLRKPNQGDSWPTSVNQGFSKKSLTDYAQSQRGSFEKSLKDLVEIPSVSADPQRQTDVLSGGLPRGGPDPSDWRRDQGSRHRRSSDAPRPVRSERRLSDGDRL